MRFTPSFLDEIKARLQVSDVVGRRVKLKKAGREWKGLSPFQQEKSPSFTVNDQKQFYHDFSTGKHGNIFDFVMETEGVSFPEAVERLASLAGLPIPRTSREEEQREERAKSLFDVMELATKYFEQNLASNVGAQARGYLSDRAITPSTTVEFRLGYATANRFGLKEFLGSKGVSVGDMIETGLLIAGDDIPVPYDRFRDRVMIPIHDQRGRVIGFGGRALKSEVQPKYLNSPETSIFHKGSVVFNFHRAREPAHKAGSVVAVEGYMDAIAIYQAGIKGVVATMGTAFTEEQVTALWRLSSEPVVCFDADRAGIAAAHRSIDRILPLLTVGKSFQFAFMVGEKDPDDLIRERGVEAFKDVLAGALPIWDVLWSRETEGVNVKSPDSQASLEKKLTALVRTIRDSSVQTAYVRTSRLQLAELFWQAVRGKPKSDFVSYAARDGKARARRDGKTKIEIDQPVSIELKSGLEDREHSRQKVLLGMLVHYPQFLDEKQDTILRLKFAADLDRFCSALYQLLVMEKELSVQQIYSRLGDVFYNVLHDIHGMSPDGRSWGHKLFARFPLLAITPPPPLDFVSKSMDHLARRVHLDELDYDIQRAKTSAGDNDNAFDLLLSLIRERQNEHANIEVEGAELAEEAAEIRRFAVPNYKKTALAAPQHLAEVVLG
ncbi:DNA primase [Bradyrhizobium sp. AUGA SZCCT0222]|uniref:DNA primase n=1 Tax=Bradyrhizobium sp. AUGA SZCCT0222 TaxID=2807668 RepID=UPI001BAD3812|nr:DNA primase [Bradyrhizobium sp. AUGA SZCCT0222]MBR1270852.1 DNA primase [Bradyrhizobium sp. AUGA SZCCT0222]